MLSNRTNFIVHIQSIAQGSARMQRQKNPLSRESGFFCVLNSKYQLNIFCNLPLHTTKPSICQRLGILFGIFKLL